MVMKKDGRKRDIKSKLVAAVCMLLVSCIMMVSSTYAWFTLSTAPEVTGISTAIGANGNLEMALLPNGTDIDSIAKALAAIGTSSNGTASAYDKNTTWGNLVNLSDNRYGMNNISLYPSKLNATAGATNLSSEAYLQIPSYGADGRVNGMKLATMNGIYSGTAFNQGGYGVRVVGTSSGMSEREIAYRGALAAASTAMNNANKAASKSMADGGTSLATVAMALVLNKDNATFKLEDVQALKDVYDDMLAENGALTLLETALREYIAAAYLANADDANYATGLEAIRDKANALSSLITYAPNAAKTALTTVIEALDDAKAAVSGESSGLETLLQGKTASDTFAWADFDDYVDTLGSTDTMLINGEDMDYWRTDDNKDGMPDNVAQLASAGGVSVEMADGIYVDIADFCETVTGSVMIKNVSLNLGSSSLNLGDVPATMTAKAKENPVYLAQARAAVPTFVGGSSSTAPISNYYGYIIDMGFRTNAADSFLQLQTSAIDRIYSDNTSNADTMGGGSSMSFDVAGHTGYDAESVKTLMGCIRVVFFNPEDGHILSYARLDEKTLFLSGTEYTMDLKLCNEDGSWKTNLDNTAADETKALVALQQNQATAVSALVYLDGEKLTNADVSYSSDIKGTMNLQFSSSANLVPMEYDDLLNANNFAVTKPADVTGNATAAKNADYSFTVDSTKYDLSTLAVTVGGQAVTPTDNGNGSYTIPAASVTGAIVITVNAASGT